MCRRGNRTHHTRGRNRARTASSGCPCPLWTTWQQGCRDISRYFLYIAICDISRYFLVISRYKRTWIYGDSRKNRRRKTEIYEKVIQQMQLVLRGHTWHAHTFEFSCGAAYIYTVNYPPPLKFSRPCTCNRERL